MTDDKVAQVEFIKSSIRTVPDFPKPGIQFRDITTLLQNPKSFAVSLNDFFERYKEFFDLNGMSNNESRNTEDELELNTESVRKIITPLLKENKVLEAITLLEKNFGNKIKHKRLTFRDWFEIVKSHYERQFDQEA